MNENRATLGPRYRYNEFKYLVPPRCVALVRQLLDAQIVAPDPFPQGRVQSIYYDTIDRAFLGQCKDGQGRKIKFRIRRYDDQPEAQLQVKLKNGFAVAKLKSRFPFAAEPPAEWPVDHGRDSATSAEIRTLALAAPTLRPVVDLRYHRERFALRDYRITLDSRITASPCPGLVAPRLGWASLEFAVLEVKTREPAPLLPPALRELVSFSSLSKYGILMRLLLDEVDTLCKYEPY